MDHPKPWHKIWMNMALIISERSKDPNTKVGAILVSPDNRKIHAGYNGFASGVMENDERWSRPNKYDYVIHAEENALLNAKCDLRGWTCYVTLKPCERCASKIVQAEIKKVIYLNTSTNSANYKLSDLILKEGGVDIVSFEEINEQDIK